MKGYKPAYNKMGATRRELLEVYVSIERRTSMYMFSLVCLHKRYCKCIYMVFMFHPQERLWALPFNHKFYIYTVRMRTCIGFQKGLGLGIDHLGVDIGEKVPTNYDGTQPSNVPK